MHSGFVSIIGKPNVGKSTLLNRLVGMKLAGVSKKPQTTCIVIRGILSESRGQIVFLDTPGFHEPKDAIGRFMMRQATQTFLDADLFYVLADPVPPDEGMGALLDRIEAEQLEDKMRKPVFCLINKIDTISKPELLPVLDQYQKRFSFDEMIPISAQRGDQVDLLVDQTYARLPEHEPYFPPDITSDQAERVLVVEFIREKIFRFTGEEIPYAAAVQIEAFEEEDKLIRVHAVIFTEKDSQKAILIGAAGQKLKQIGTAARKDLEQFLGKHVFLKLWVKTLKNWKKDERYLKRLGFK
ncbi:MAG: GTPase Era [Omnitrophica bacterium RIFCSPLOWO2_12_FULL_50_11]|nr:MAG: GTPase Era [Omnitrophica bacterium RIFCSPLOWO2_12_FULL_50_11]